MKKIIFSLVLALLCSLAGATLQPVLTSQADCEHMQHGQSASGVVGGAQAAGTVHHNTASSHACCVSPGLMQAPLEIRITQSTQTIAPYGVPESDLGVSYPIFKPPKTAL